VPLLGNIFFNKAPLHDGAVVVREGRILSAGCILPLSNQDMNLQYGTRHRAALGISEESDAVAVVVSEETGNISICYKGALKVFADRDSLLKRLRFLLLPQTEKNEFFSGLFSRKKDKKGGSRSE
jgi:diadenylate cyclase